MYVYKCRYRSNYDGDTVRLDIDLGFGVWMKNQVVRLYGIDAPELRRPTLEAGRAAKEWLRNQLTDLSPNKHITLRSHKDRKGKYGRWLGDLMLVFRHADDDTILFERNVNHMMVGAGHAVEREY